MSTLLFHCSGLHVSQTKKDLDGSILNLLRLLEANHAELQGGCGGDMAKIGCHSPWLLQHIRARARAGFRQDLPLSKKKRPGGSALEGPSLASGMEVQLSRSLC